MRSIAIASITAGVVAFVGAGVAGVSQAAPGPVSVVGPVNPVAQPLNGHAANSGFLVFSEGNVHLGADESEGTIAAGGSLSFSTSYNVAAHLPSAPTFTAPGDSVATFLYVGGGVEFPDAAVAMKVLNGGYAKIGDTATYSAHDRDQNNARMNYSIVPPGAAAGTNPQIAGTVAQPAASVGAPVPRSLIDIDGAFSLYRPTSTALSRCESNLLLTDANGAPIARPITSPTSVFLTVTPGMTNVLNLTASELGQVREITYRTTPTISAPLLINVAGDYSGTFPNQAGASGEQARYILWNFASASRVVVDGGASMEGTLYAPGADVSWLQTNNVEGNIIAASFTHGGPPASGQPREVHDFPFAAQLSCNGAPGPNSLLTLEKIVRNSHGSTGRPSDWILTAAGPETVTGPGGSETVTDRVVVPGEYRLSESGTLAGYTAGSWSCTGGVLDGDVVTVPADAHVTCRIENTFESPPAPDATPVPTPTATLPPVDSDITGGGAGEPPAGAASRLADTGGGVSSALFWASLVLLLLGLALVARSRGNRDVQ